MNTENIEDWIKKLKKFEGIIVVEGKKDKKALASLGIKQVFALQRIPLYNVVEIIASKTNHIIILTDLDREGKKLYSRLKQDLQKHRVKIDSIFREYLFKETNLRQIEGILSYSQKNDNAQII